MLFLGTISGEAFARPSLGEVHPASLHPSPGDERCPGAP